MNDPDQEIKCIPTRLLTIIAVSVAFGAAVTVLKGSAADVRDSIGNISAPWLLLPYFAGTATSGWMRGALIYELS